MSAFLEHDGPDLAPSVSAPPPRRLTRPARRATARQTVHGQSVADAFRDVCERLEALEDVQCFSGADKVEWLRLRRLEARLAEELGVAR